MAHPRILAEVSGCPQKSIQDTHSAADEEGNKSPSPGAGTSKSGAPLDERLGVNSSGSTIQLSKLLLPVDFHEPVLPHTQHCHHSRIVLQSCWLPVSRWWRMAWLLTVT
eukprot:1336801-Rhodomonas_salina.1